MEISRVVSDPTIMMGKPVIRGTRVTVEIILERLACGESCDQIREAYPHLEAGDIEAALSFEAVATGC